MPTLKDEDYLTAAVKAVQEGWDLYKKEDWKVYKQNESDCVFSRTGSNRRKILMLQAEVDFPPKPLLVDLFDGYANMMNWYSEVKETRRIQIVDDHTDIIYQVCNEAFGGIVAGRDFVNLRRWDFIDGCYVMSCTKTEHPSLPINNNLVRGENVIGALIIQGAIPDNPQKSQINWIIDLDLKLSLPKFLVDKEMANVMLRYVQELRQHLSQLKNNIDT